MGPLLVALSLLPRPVLSGVEHTIDAAPQYRVHYTLQGQDALAHGAADGDKDGVPDDAQAVAGGLVQVHQKWVAGAGMRAPLADGGGGGDGRIDVYVRKLDGPRGYTHTEDVGQAPATSAWIEVDPRSALESPNRLAAAAGHELVHAIQDAYTAHTSASWFREAHATWAEDLEFGLRDESTAHYLALLRKPQTRLDAVDGSHEYDEMALVSFLVRTHSDLSFDRLWRGVAVHGGDALTALAEELGESTAMTLCRFAVWLDTACSERERSDGGVPPAGCDAPGVTMAPSQLARGIDLPPLSMARLQILTAPLCDDPKLTQFLAYYLHSDDAAMWGVGLLGGGSGCGDGVSGYLPFHCESGSCLATSYAGRGSAPEATITMQSEGIDCVDPAPDLSRASDSGVGAIANNSGCSCTMGGAGVGSRGTSVLTLLALSAAWAARRRRRRPHHP